ncbi:MULTISPECIES: 4-hydroxy-tetrahydrodipicolinate synthase [Aminobacterium]|mgnify:CR=1 FL=1|jgi:4-hydroxy-tetrahydrodipicolinate synthase|uniref:4-hydroxy-tetrahydrodipicolinate synthase n=1 Tax=Aminobacterium TaxID=81466 RepID=UPI000B277E6D|nr:MULTISPECIES: 4-hydroxy-tetrahydrodipicolinate synthase [unclassified Aminobacterium]MDD2378992.1 4-hydroxy-tetrahydrodipicolinate synthase [Aminobacterium colombiense]MDD4585823.1 4-hydroxy-tetrahydrodipicolinate synthase [Aminobacterium colombiense]NLK30934.1 4-hydroxy-tetrahydrodipicolinate synthase [Aminobacterium colombiense]
MFSGTGTAVVTPFKSGKVDYESFERFLNFQINGGVDFLVVLGTTGEAPAVTAKEREEIVRFVVKTVEGRVPVVVGTGSNSTEAAIELSNQALSLGVDGVLVVTPYYNKPPQEGLYQHYRTIASRINKGRLIIYNVPGRTGVNILPETVLRLAEIENIVGIKEASGDEAQVDYLIRKMQKQRPNFFILSGNDDQAFHLVNAGGDGVISVLSNVAPRETSTMIRFALDGEIGKARELHLRLFPLMKGLFCETNPIPVKYGVSRLGYCENELRLPLIPASSKAMAVVDEALKESGIY